jgi:hypothetical protein
VNCGQRSSTPRGRFPLLGQGITQRIGAVSFGEERNRGQQEFGGCAANCTLNRPRQTGKAGGKPAISDSHIDD